LLNINLIFASDIDWENSTMKVEFTKESNFVPNFNCFGHDEDSLTDNNGKKYLNTGVCEDYNGDKNYCVWENLENLGFSDEDNSPEITSCFNQAGNYKMTVQIVDYAGNKADPDISNFSIKAGTPTIDTNNSTGGIMSRLVANSNCKNGDLVANNSDSCELSLLIRDAFGNPVTQLKDNNNIEILNTSIFPDDANSGTATLKLKGLRINNNILPNKDNGDSALKVTSGNTDEVKTTLNLTSIVPTMKLVGAFLGKTTTETLNLEIKVPGIKEDGTVDNDNLVTFEYNTFSPEIKFKPWAFANLDFLNNAASKLILDVENQLKENIPSSSFFSSTLVTNIKTFIYPHRLPKNVTIEGVDADGKTPLGLTDDNPNEIKDEDERFWSKLVATAGDINVSGDIALTSRVAYNILGERIIYPGGAIGKFAGIDADDADGYDGKPLSVGIIGASIEGNLLNTKNTTVLQDADSLRLGDINLTDVREKIFTNAYQISRGIEVKNNGDKIIFDSTWFDHTDSVVVSGSDVFIGAGDVPTGRNTLIIKNANLVIEGDMTYSSATKNNDSFGIILINDNVKEAPITGNILIKDDVKHIVGTYFAEGGLISVNSSVVHPWMNNGTREVNSIVNGLEENNTQLVLEGTILSHNTLGGSFPKNGSTDFQTPWKTGSTTEIKNNSIIYDLHQVRQYRPEYDDDGNLTQDTQNRCYQPDGANCDNNPAAFVIRVDGKATRLTPPGFEGTESYFQEIK